MDESEDQQIKEFATLCRLCSKSTADKQKIDLFTTDTDNIIDKIFDCVKVKITKNDYLPVCICEDCTKIVQNFHKYQLQCLVTQQSLHQKITALKKQLVKVERDGFYPLDVVVKIEDDEHNHSATRDNNSSPEPGGNDDDNNFSPSEGSQSGSEEEEEEEQGENKKVKKDAKKSPAGRKTKAPKPEGEKVKRVPLTKEERRERSRAKYQTYLRPCDICGQMIHKFRMQYHINTHNGVTPFKCDGDENTCTRAFSCPYMLAVHKRDHHLNRVFTCELCGKSYNVQNSLRNHKQREHMAPKYECSVCGRKYKTSTYLKQHFRTHTGERPYFCNFDGCTKSFAKSYNLKIHKRSHTKEKPCKCPVEGCGNSYGYNCLLKAHMEKIHPHLMVPPEPQPQLTHPIPPRMPIISPKVEVPQ